jgi:hypothetical protein
MSEPAITLRAIHDSGTGNTAPTRVVIHATCGGRGFVAESANGVSHNTAVYFQNPNSGGSAHYIEDGSREDHCVPENVIAWHAPPNEHSLGIEICGEASYSRDQWLSPQVWPAVQRAAWRTHELCVRYGIPLQKISVADLLAGHHGICGHVDVSQAWHQSDHTDPGPNFPWDAPRPAPSSPARLAWNLGPGNYYGNIAGPNESHGGGVPSDIPFVRNIQQWLIYHGCVPGVAPAAWALSGWADGKWEAPTDTAMLIWHNHSYPGQPKPKQCWSDDYNLLARP